MDRSSQMVFSTHLSSTTGGGGGGGGERERERERGGGGEREREKKKERKRKKKRKRKRRELGSNPTFSSPSFLATYSLPQCKART